MKMIIICNKGAKKIEQGKLKEFRKLSQEYAKTPKLTFFFPKLDFFGKIGAIIATNRPRPPRNAIFGIDARAGCFFTVL